MSDSEKERPLECSSCSKKLRVCYTDVKEQIVNRFYMCKDCPLLQQYLAKPTSSEEREALAHLVCGNCKTSLSNIKKGEALGCFECYEIFEDYLIQAFIDEELFPESLDITHSLHQGHQPGELKEVGSSLKIFALNETLNEMIHREDYEQAASIRDQIKELKQKQKNHEQNS